MLMEARALSMRYPVGRGRRRGVLHAVDDVSLAIAPGECLGLVGESGCGKSTLARLLARLVVPTEGRLVFEGIDLDAISPRAFAASAARAGIQMVFQDPDRKPQSPSHGLSGHRRSDPTPRPRRPRFARAGRAGDGGGGAGGGAWRRAIRISSPGASAPALASPARWRCRRGC